MTKIKNKCPPLKELLGVLFKNYSHLNNIWLLSNVDKASVRQYL